MIVGEKEEQLIALDVSTDRQLGRVQGLPAEWRATVKRQAAGGRRGDGSHPLPPEDSHQAHRGTGTAGGAAHSGASPARGGSPEELRAVYGRDQSAQTRRLEAAAQPAGRVSGASARGGGTQSRTRTSFNLKQHHCQNYSKRGRRRQVLVPA